MLPPSSSLRRLYDTSSDCMILHPVDEDLLASAPLTSELFFAERLSAAQDVLQPSWPLLTRCQGGCSPHISCDDQQYLQILPDVFLSWLRTTAIDLFHFSVVRYTQIVFIFSINNTIMRLIIHKDFSLLICYFGELYYFQIHNFFCSYYRGLFFNILIDPICQYF